MAYPTHKTYCRRCDGKGTIEEPDTWAIVPCPECKEGVVNTETIDKVFLELSQFTSATTRRELQLEKECKQLLHAILWALGEEGEFPSKPKNGGQFWWRSELRKKAGLPIYRYANRQIIKESSDDQARDKP